MQVLIADDESTSRILLEEALMEWGYDVCAAADGNEAWDIVNRPDGPRLVILDWMMPGMDGPELCRKMRESLSAQYVYVVLLTSKNQKQDVILGMDSGADAFLTKPVDLGELRSRLSAARRILEHQSVLQKTREPAGANTPTATAPAPTEEANIPERLRRVIRDLTHDGLLAVLPRMQIGEYRAPVLGRMPLLNKLGEGGMGAVYRAYNPRLQKDVAVKVLSTTIFKQRSDAAARFYREAQIAAMVHSPHLVVVMDVEQELGILFLVMEFVDGKTATAALSTAIAEGNIGLIEEQALEISLGVAKGLAAAHSNGVVHRDVKPDNVLIPWDANRDKLSYHETKLADLGIARHELAQAGLTESNASLGTAGYMAPEQIRDAKRAGRPADVFSTGALLYSLLTGRAPFIGPSLFDVCMDTINKPYRPVSDFRQGVSAETLAVISTCLEKVAEVRYSDGAQLATALEKALNALRNPTGPITRPKSEQRGTRLDSMGFPIPDTQKAVHKPKREEDAE